MQKIDILFNKSLIAKNDIIIVGLSGGPDSVCLLHYLTTLTDLNLTIIAAHLNHEWRIDADFDQNWCLKLSDCLNVKFETAKISELDFKIKKSGSKECDARDYRRYFLKNIFDKYRANSVAIAHNQDDKIETFFIRIIRGSTISGLSSIQEQSENYIRPLLKTSKKDIFSYLENNKLNFLTDSTNTNIGFLRNNLRLNVIYKITNIDSRFNKNISNLISNIDATNDFLDEIVNEHFGRISSIENGKLHLNFEKMFILNQYLHKKILLLFLIKSNVKFNLSNSFLDEIVKFLKNNKSNKHEISNSWSIIKNKQIMHIHLNINI